MDSVSSVATVGGSILLEGVKNMIVGLGVVFAVLILLCVIIWAFKFLDGIGAPNATMEERSSSSFAKKSTAKSHGQMQQSGLTVEGVDPETCAVILGVMAEELGGNFKVSSIKKAK